MLSRSREQSSLGILGRKSGRGGPGRLPGVGGAHLFLLQMLNACHVLPPAPGGGEAEMSKNPILSELSFQLKTQLEMRPGRIGRGQFPPGGGKTQNICRTGL